VILREIRPWTSLLYCLPMWLMVGWMSGCKNGDGIPDHPRAVAGVGMRDVRFFSAALGREMPYRVFLPETREAGQKLPVVYLLHGRGADFRDWSNNSDISKYALRGVILVMPEGNSSFYLNAAQIPRDKYEDYLVHDLVKDVEGRFPALMGRAHRAIVGISMGGLGRWRWRFGIPRCMCSRVG
jgi:S-formylglutathione hydrolase FrmB